MTNYDPWRDAAERHPDVHIERCETAPASGAWVPSERVIFVGDHLDRAGRRSTLAHELAHVDLDHRPTGHRWFDRRAERDADDLAAGRLIALDELVDALLVHPLHPTRVADELEVQGRILKRRLGLLTEAEKDYVEARLAEREHVA